MQTLARHNKQKLLDLLAERLTFERSGVQLYDAIIAKIQASADGDAHRLLDQLCEHRDQEKEHESWLADQIHALGGDGECHSEMSELVKRESRGLMEVILEADHDLHHLLHALQAAELADHAGWDLLVELAHEAGDLEAERGFTRRIHDEEEHLAFVRRALQRLARQAVLGQDVAQPAAP